MRYTESAPKGDTAVTRVGRLMDDLNELMTTNRTLTVAPLRALLCGKPDVVPHVRNFVAITENVLTATIVPNGATAADREAVQFLERFWFSLLISWVIGVDDADRITEVMREAASRVLV